MAEIGKHARGLPGLPDEHAQIPVWNSEDWYYEDFEIGDKIRSIRRTISEGESMLFNSLVMDHHPYVSDQEFAAQEGVFGKRLVAGAMVFSYGLGLAATNCLNSFSYGYDRLRFIRPVFIGDTIYTIRENLAKEALNETMGKLRVSYSVFKGEGELVLYAEHILTALYRKPDKFAQQAKEAMARKAEQAKEAMARKAEQAKEAMARKAEQAKEAMARKAEQAKEVMARKAEQKKAAKK